MLLFGGIAYLGFLASFGYLIAFCGDLGVPRSVSRGPDASFGRALLGNALLVMLFGVQHSVMARSSVKRRLARWVPAAAMRSLFVLSTTGVLAFLYYGWRPLPSEVWNIGNGVLAAVTWGLFTYGALLTLWASFMINHFDLFGLRQVWLHFRGVPYRPVPFQVGYAYRQIRHPLMLGMLLMFWAAPVMSVGRLVLAVLMSIYVVIGIRLEERDLIDALGLPYRRYLEAVPAFFPRLPFLPGRPRSSSDRPRPVPRPDSDELGRLVDSADLESGALESGAVGR